MIKRWTHPKPKPDTRKEKDAVEAEHQAVSKAFEERADRLKSLIEEMKGERANGRP